MKFYFFESIVPIEFLKIGHIAQFYNTLQKADDIHEADMAFCPIPYEYLHDVPDDYYTKTSIKISRQETKNLFDAIVQQAQLHSKKLIIIYYWDVEQHIAIDNTIFIRTSLLQTDQIKYKNCFGFPAWTAYNDYLKEYFNDELPINTWQQKPSIGFRGTAAEYNIKDKIKLSLQTVLGKNNKFLQSGWPHPYQVRTSAMDVLAKNENINTAFAITSFGGGSVQASLQSDYKKLYIENLRANPYGLCSRGFGNYTFRFYELMATGRIPVFINTNCVLPYDFIINYKQHCVWIEEEDIKHTADILIEFNNNHKGSFVDLQKANRKLWEDYLSPKGFTKNFEHHFTQQ